MANKGVSTAAARRLLRETGPEIARRYEAGESFAAIGRSLGVSTAAVRNAVKRNGGTFRGRGNYSSPWMKERAREVRRRYEAGETLAAISESLSVSFTTARLDLIAAGGRTMTTNGFKAKPLKGPANPSWRGGTHLNKFGYRLVWVEEDDPMASMRAKRNHYVFEHRLVMARALGRPLTKGETVHHVNGDKLDNRIENLQLRSGQHGPGARFRCHDCGSQNVGPVEI